MKIVSTEIVLAVQVQADTPTRLGLFMSELSRKLGGQLINNNIPPTAPAEIPRISLFTSTMLVNLALDRLQVISKISNSNEKSTIKVLQPNLVSSIKIFENYLRDIGSPFMFAGMITTVHFPKKGAIPQLKLAESLHDDLLTIDRENRSMASFLVQTGYLEGDYYTNFTISAYEKKEFKMPTNIPSGGTFQIDISNSPASESGFEVRVDVNNKPKKNKMLPIEELNALVAKSSSEIDSIEKRFLLNSTNVTSFTGRTTQ